MDELQTILTLKSQVKDEIRRAEDKLKALETVEKMIRDSHQTASNVVAIQPKLYKAMKQNDAICDIFRRAAGRKLTAKEVTEGLERGGFEFKSKRPATSVFSTLKKNLKGLYIEEKIGGRACFGLAEEKPNMEITKAS